MTKSKDNNNKCMHKCIKIRLCNHNILMQKQFFCLSSKECQVKDWPDHKRKCNITKQSIEQDCKNTARKEECHASSTNKKETTQSPCKMQTVLEAASTKTGFNKNSTNGDSHKREIKDKTFVEKRKPEGLEYIVSESSKKDNNILIFIKHNKAKSELELEMPQDGETIYQHISNFLQIPVTKLKLVCKGKIITADNVSSVIHNKAVFLALGEASESEDGLDKGDIDTLMRQLNVERNIAVKALKRTGSLLDAIFDVGNSM